MLQTQYIGETGQCFSLKKNLKKTPGSLQFIDYSLIGVLTSLTPTERLNSSMQIVQGICGR